MKIFFNKKVILLPLIFFISFSILLHPKTSKAQFVVSDPGNTVQSTLTAANTSISAVNNLSMQVKEYVLDGLATIVVKQLIRQITSSVVSWINSGFQGSPSFLSNPGAFFLDVADQITGDFIAKKSPELAQLCSPFSIDIRFALSFKYRPNIPKRYTCTLSKIITNTANAVEGASINGFTAGDFKQGGWPAFVSLTTEPQNNIYGAYLTAETELSWRVANAKSQQKDEISAGSGFLSWRDPKCSAEVTKYNKEIKSGRSTVNSGADGSESSSYKPLKSKLDCPVQTPGSVIQGTLQNNLNGPLRELELADEFNEIVNALFAQLVTQVLQKGLGGVSSKGSDGQSYLDKSTAQFNAESAGQLNTIKTEATKVDAYRKNLTQYKQYIDEASGIMLDIKNNYESAKVCYQAKIDANNNAFRSNTLIQQAQNAISVINSTLATRVIPKFTLTSSASSEADVKLKELTATEEKVKSAKTTEELRNATTVYNKLIQDGGFLTANAVLKAQDDLNTLKRGDGSALKQDALYQLQSCMNLY